MQVLSNLLNGLNKSRALPHTSLLQSVMVQVVSLQMFTLALQKSSVLRKYELNPSCKLYNANLDKEILNL